MSVESFGEALSASERASVWQKAVHLFARMNLADVTPDSISEAPSMTSFMRTTKHNTVEVEVNDFLLENFSGFNAVVTACDAAKKWEQAGASFALVSRMLHGGTIDIILTSSLHR